MNPSEKSGGALDAGINALVEVARDDILAATDDNALQQAKARHLGKQSELAGLMKTLGSLGPEERRVLGQAVNVAKRDLEALVAERRDALLEAAAVGPGVDLSLPGRMRPVGRLHPLRLAAREIEDIFIGMGFDIQQGPHIEDEWFNFGALNMPEGHPARDMQDTFYLEGGKLLRTHTSGVQIHTMLAEPPPLRMISHGIVYRSDDIDATHSPMFQQVEGLMVDDRVTFADLKGALVSFARQMFGADRPTRFRASYFPFTEPSAEMDVWFEEKGRWLEILGCGMVNPEVFRQVGRPEYLADGIRGFAFGMGVERIAMLKYGLPDLRMLFENDVRFLGQF